MKSLSQPGTVDGGDVTCARVVREHETMKRPMHVAMVAPSAKGGHARYAHELLTALHRFHRQDLRLSLVTSEDLAEEFRRADYDIHDVLPRLAPRQSFRFRAHWAASRLEHYVRRDAVLLSWARRQRDLDLIHYQEEPLLPKAHFASMKATGARVVATVHNIIPHRYRIQALRSWTDKLLYTGWRTCDALFVHSDGLREQLDRILGSGAPPIFVSPHGKWVVGDVVDAPMEARLSARRLLLFGVQRRNKGLDVMLDTMRFLPGFRLVVAGQFTERGFYDEIRARIERECLPVEIADGYVPNDSVASLFAQASLAVLPYTDFHAESGVLHLAASYRVPVVATDVGALGESVRRDRIGLVVRPRDPEAFASSVLALMDAATYRAAREACDAVAGLGWTDAARKTVEGYRSTAWVGLQ